MPRKVTPARTRRGAQWLTFALLAFPAPGCDWRAEPGADRSAETREEVVLRSGELLAVGKSVSGRAELLRQGDTHWLRLVGVNLKHEGDVRVYLVGLDAAPSTSAVDSAELKYDLGPLEASSGTQLLRLPGAPDPKLRAVVLWNPKYGANLAAAGLR